MCACTATIQENLASNFFLIDERLQAHDRQQADIHMFAVYFLESVDVTRSSTVNLKLENNIS